MFVPYVVIKLVPVLGRGFCCCKFMVCYYLHFVCRVYACSSYCDKALSFLVRWFCCRCLFILCYCRHGVSAIYVCSSCCNKAAVRSGELVLNWPIFLS